MHNSHLFLSICRFCFIVIALSAAGKIKCAACFAADNLDFSFFRSVHEQSYNSIKTGSIKMRYKSYEFIPSQTLKYMLEREKESMEAAKLKFRKDPNLTESKRENLIRQVDAGFQMQLRRLSVQERLVDVNRTLVFDKNSEKCKLEEQPSEPNISEPVFSDKTLNRIVITLNDGTQYYYNKRADAITTNKINTVAVELPFYFDAYLGLLRPAWFAELAERDVSSTVSQGKLDGRKVIVVDLIEPERSFELKIYADPDIGYKYRKIESFIDGKLVELRKAKDYHLFNGIYFPMSHEYIVYGDDPNNPISKKEVVKVLNAEFNQLIDPNTFKIQCTTKTIFYQPELNLRFKLCPEKASRLSVEKILEMAVSSTESKK